MKCRYKYKYTIKNLQNIGFEGFVVNLNSTKRMNIIFKELIILKNIFAEIYNT